MSEHNDTVQELEYLKRALRLASELEHQLMCAYLFTAFSLKQDEDEGITRDQASQASGWRSQITGVAVQEMLHLALVSNILTAIGDKPYFARQNFPLNESDMKRFGYKDARLGLWRFGECALERFVWYESHDSGRFPQCFPEEMAELLSSADAMEHYESLQKLQLSTLVKLYEKIATLLKVLSEKMGEDKLFKVPASQQITDQQVTGLFNFPPALSKSSSGEYCLPLLNAITSLQSALVAINTIILQGEGDFPEWEKFLHTLVPPAEYPSYWPFPEIQSPSHEVTFTGILQAIGSAEFEAARNVANNPLPGRIDDPFTKSVSELFNNLYEVMLDVLGASFAHEGSQFSVASLTQNALRLMVYVMSPLGNMLTQMPAGNGKMAGPSFIYTPEEDQSWNRLEQRLREVATRARSLAAIAPDPDRMVWLTPSYLGIPPQPTADHDYPQQSIAYVLRDIVGVNMDFMADRVAEVSSFAVPELHVCMGLNACKGQDVSGTASMAGVGQCATADPHICAGQNSCKHEGGCGFTPSPTTQPDLQDFPGQNDCKAQGACGSPVLPTIVNTYGKNTDPSFDRGGDPAVYGTPGTHEPKGHGSVWRYARMLFEADMQKRGIAYGPSNGPGDIGNGDFKGWSPGGDEE